MRLDQAYRRSSTTTTIMPGPPPCRIQLSGRGERHPADAGDLTRPSDNTGFREGDRIAVASTTDGADLLASSGQPDLEARNVTSGGASG
jgi:hypothetical protein